MKDNVWILKYLGDIECDLSAFHRVDDIREMPARKFFLFANRCIAYKGALRYTAEKESEDSKTTATGRQRSEAPKVHKKIEHNHEAFNLGLIESSSG